MMKRRRLQPDDLTIWLKKSAQKEGAAAASEGRARNSNPYPMATNTTFRLEWFRGYDKRLAELTRSR